MSDLNDMTYEQAIVRLEEIVAILEKGGTPLDDAVKLFEEGAALSRLCNEKLKKAELKITELTGGNKGNG